MTEFHAENQGLDAIGYVDPKSGSNMITTVFLEGLSLSWSLKGSKRMKSGDQETRVIIEMDQCSWTLCQVLVLFSVHLVLLLTLSQ